MDTFEEFVSAYDEKIDTWKSWYYAVEPSLELKEELDAKIMGFVKSRLL